MFLKILMISGFMIVIIFLAHIYPNLKKPWWQRKIVSADYLRVRDRGPLADDVLISAIAKDQSVWQLYINLFTFYATPWDMKKLFSVVSSGYSATGHPGIGACLAWCLMEEGEFDRAEEILKREDVHHYLIEFSLPYLPRLFLLSGNYRECEKSFLSFYGEINSLLSANNSEGDSISSGDEKKIFSDLTPDELVVLLCARRMLGMKWRETAALIPVKSIHEEDCWESFQERLSEEKDSFRVESGIYGPAEKLANNRMREIDIKLETVGEYLGKKYTGKAKV